MAPKDIRQRSRLAFLASALLAAGVLAAGPALAAGDWNDAKIKWHSYEDGLAVAKKEKKPICLIFYTDWCPHCRNYSAVFHKSGVVDRAKKFVMIRINKDQNRELSAKYAVDGEYIPRTYFLSPDGKLAQEIHAPRDRFRYFYDEHDPKSVLAGMDEALKKLK